MHHHDDDPGTKKPLAGILGPGFTKPSTRARAPARGGLYANADRDGDIIVTLVEFDDEPRVLH